MFISRSTCSTNMSKDAKFLPKTLTCHLAIVMEDIGMLTDAST